MLPVEPEEFRDLQNGSLTEDELARRSEQRLRRQKAATAAMEISTDDQYEMYSRLSANAKKLSYPATTKDLWDAFAASPYLASKGATVSTDGVWYLPGSEESCELRVTNQRDAITDEVTYHSWGNSAVDELLTAICSKIPNNGPIQRISVQNGSMEMVGYLVASTDGEKLVT